MTKKAVKRVMRKKRQLKKQVKKRQQQQQEQQQRVMQPMMMGYGHQMYGNADGTMQQLRNQNQTTIDQINSMTSALRSLQNENKKNEAMISELTKKRKDAEHEKDKAKIDLEIAEDKARDVESMMKQREHYIEKQQQLEKEIMEQEGENNKYKQMKLLEEQKREKHEKEMEGIREKQEIEANQIAAEVKKVQDETKILATKNQAMFEYIGSDMFKNPLNHLTEAYINRMKEEEKETLMNNYIMMDEMNEKLLEQIKKGEEVNNERMVVQLKASIEAQEKFYAINQQENQLLKNREATYNHLLKKHEQLTNDTNDVIFENERLKYKFNDINNQSEVNESIKTQQAKLASAQAMNEILNNKLDLQKRTNSLQLENSALIQSNKILEGKEPYVDEKAADNDKNDDNEDDKGKSLFDIQLESLETQKIKFEAEHEQNQLLQQRNAEQKRHKQVIASQRVQLKALSSNNNNNNDDTMNTRQTNYQIQQQNQQEEQQLNNNIEKQKIVNEIVQIREQKDPNGTVWRTTYHNPFPYVEKGVTIKNYQMPTMIEEVKQSYLKAISEASPETINFKSPFKIDTNIDYSLLYSDDNNNNNNNNNEFVEEEEEDSRGSYVVFQQNDAMKDDLSSSFVAEPLSANGEISDDSTISEANQGNQGKRNININSFSRRRPQ